jgi:hypothetical protein
MGARDFVLEQIQRMEDAVKETDLSIEENHRDAQKLDRRLADQLALIVEWREILYVINSKGKS